MMRVMISIHHSHQMHPNRSASKRAYVPFLVSALDSERDSTLSSSRSLKPIPYRLRSFALPIENVFTIIYELRGLLRMFTDF